MSVLGVFNIIGKGPIVISLPGLRIAESSSLY